MILEGENQVLSSFLRAGVGEILIFRCFGYSHGTVIRFYWVSRMATISCCTLSSTTIIDNQVTLRVPLLLLLPKA